MEGAKDNKSVGNVKSVLLPGMKEAFGPLPSGVLPESPKAVEEKQLEPKVEPRMETDAYGHPKPKKWPEDY